MTAPTSATSCPGVSRWTSTARGPNVARCPARRSVSGRPTADLGRGAPVSPTVVVTGAGHGLGAVDRPGAARRRLDRGRPRPRRGGCRPGWRRTSVPQSWRSPPTPPTRPPSRRPSTRSPRSRAGCARRPGGQRRHRPLRAAGRPRPRRLAAVVDVNLTGTFLTARAVARRMLAARHPGPIVTVTSMNGVAAGPNAGAYGATKAGVALLTTADGPRVGPPRHPVQRGGPRAHRRRHVRAHLRRSRHPAATGRAGAAGSAGHRRRRGRGGPVPAVRRRGLRHRHRAARRRRGHLQRDRHPAPAALGRLGRPRRRRRRPSPRDHQPGPLRRPDARLRRHLGAGCPACSPTRASTRSIVEDPHEAIALSRRPRADLGSGHRERAPLAAWQATATPASGTSGPSPSTPRRPRRSPTTSAAAAACWRCTPRSICFDSRPGVARVGRRRLELGALVAPAARGRRRDRDHRGGPPPAHRGHRAVQHPSTRSTASSTSSPT